jgi:hypothetical protein
MRRLSCRLRKTVYGVSVKVLKLEAVPDFVMAVMGSWRWENFFPATVSEIRNKLFPQK